MLTIFTVPKPFRGHIGNIQRNAIQSWLQLRPACEVILFGDDEGTAEVAAEFGIRHIPAVARNEYGTPLVNSMFEVAQHSATHSLMAYVNADIILLSDFVTAVQLMPKHSFLMVGHRWDLDINEPLDFNKANWELLLRTSVAENGKLHGHAGIDYFVFRRGFWRDIPPFAIGRTAWDNWLIYRTRSLGAPVIDATRTVTAIHQNHDYAHHTQGKDGIWKGPEAQNNRELAGGRSHVFTLCDVNCILTSQGLKRPRMSQRLCWSIITFSERSPSSWAKWVMVLLSILSYTRAIAQRMRQRLLSHR
jgi:hypothetical protein